jgi:hypothetical protein
MRYTFYMKAQKQHMYDPSIYFPEGVTEENISFKKLLEKTKVKATQSSGKMLNIEILVNHQWVNLGVINLNTQVLNLIYPYSLFLDEEDKKDLIFYSFENKLFKLESQKVSKNSKIKKASGLNAHVQGSAFEELCEQQLQSPTSFRNQMVEIILKSLGKDPSSTQVMFRHCGKEMVETLGDKKTQPKSDIKAIVVDNKNKKDNQEITIGISAKKTPVSTQIHMCSIDSFKNVMKSKFKIDVPLEVETALKKFTGHEGCTPQQLLKPVELAQMVKQPARFYLQQLTTSEQKSLKTFIKENLAPILRLILSEGSVKDENYYAKYLITNKIKYIVPEDFNPQVQFFDDLIKDLSKEEVSFSENGGTIKIGTKITIQAKGSGSPSQRSCLQFRKSL